MRRQVLISVVLIISMLTLSACGDNASTNVEEVSLDSATAEAVVDTAKDVTEKTEEEVKETAKSEDGSEASENAEVVEAVANGSTTAEATTAVATDSGEFNEPAVVQTSTTDYSKYGKTVHGWTGNGRGPEYLIRDDFDYANFLEGMPWTGEFWTASNGVVVKVISVDGIYERVVVEDGVGADAEPNSPYRIACNEAMGRLVDTFNAMSETIPLTSTKKTSINTSDADLVAFKNAYDAKYGGKGGSAVNRSLALFVDGVADVDRLGATFWSIRRDGDSWKLTLNTNPDNWRWSGIHQILRYLSPDGDALYDAIYDCFYVGSYDNPIEDWDSWWPVGNSQAYVQSGTQGYTVFYFK